MWLTVGVAEFFAFFFMCLCISAPIYYAETDYISDQSRMGKEDNGFKDRFTRQSTLVSLCLCSGVPLSVFLPS